MECNWKENTQAKRLLIFTAKAVVIVKVYVSVVFINWNKLINKKEGITKHAIVW